MPDPGISYHRSFHKRKNHRRKWFSIPMKNHALSPMVDHPDRQDALADQIIIKILIFVF